MLVRDDLEVVSSVVDHAVCLLSEAEGRVLTSLDSPCHRALHRVDSLELSFNLLALLFFLFRSLLFSDSLPFPFKSYLLLRDERADRQVVHFAIDQQAKTALAVFDKADGSKLACLIDLRLKAVESRDA